MQKNKKISYLANNRNTIITNDLSHTHSLHYYNTTNSEYICSCELLSHSHGYQYDGYDTAQHYRRCICMSSASLADHFFTHSYWEGGSEYTVCGGCGYAKVTTGTPTPIV